MYMFQHLADIKQVFISYKHNVAEDIVKRYVYDILYPYGKWACKQVRHFRLKWNYLYDNTFINVIYIYIHMM